MACNGYSFFFINVWIEQILFGADWVAGTGKNSGEQCEILFAELSKLAATTKNMCKAGEIARRWKFLLQRSLVAFVIVEPWTVDFKRL